MKTKKNEVPYNIAMIDKKHRELRRKRLLKSKDVPELKFLDQHTETERLPFVPP